MSTSLSRFPLESQLPEAPHHIAYFLEMGADPAPDKLGLLYGAYRDGQGEPWVLPCVADMEEAIAQDIMEGRDDHNYPLFEGIPRCVHREKERGSRMQAHGTKYLYTYN